MLAEGLTDIGSLCVDMDNAAIDFASPKVSCPLQENLL